MRDNVTVQADLSEGWRIEGEGLKGVIAGIEMPMTIPQSVHIELSSDSNPCPHWIIRGDKLRLNSIDGRRRFRDGAVRASWVTGVFDVRPESNSGATIQIQVLSGLIINRTTVAKRTSLRSALWIIGKGLLMAAVLAYGIFFMIAWLF